MQKNRNPLSGIEITKDAVVNAGVAFGMHIGTSAVYGLNNSTLQASFHYFRDSMGYTLVPAISATTFLTGLVGLYIYNRSTDPYLELNHLSPATSNYAHNNIIDHQNQKFSRVSRIAKRVGLLSALAVNVGAFALTDNMPKQKYTYYKAKNDITAPLMQTTQSDSSHIAHYHQN